MTKTKAIGWAVLFGALTIICLPSQTYACAFPFLIAALAFGLIAYKKHQRDTNIIAEADRQQATASRQLPVPAMTSKGSNRLFVPPPLQQ